MKFRSPRPIGRAITRSTTAAWGLGLLLLALAPQAHAGFSGENGLIAYVSDGKPFLTNDDIYVTDEAGGGALRVRLTNDPAADRQPAVSPNGKEIAFFSTRPHGDPLNPQRDSELYVMDAVDEDGDGEGDNLRRLTDNTATDFAPAWSPDGKRIAFASNRDGNNELYTMDADVCDPAMPPDPECSDPEVVRLTHDPASDQFPVFSPDGSTIAFQSAPVGVNPEIFLMDASGTGPPTNLTHNAALDALPDFAPDGARLTFSSNRDGGDVDTWSMNIDGSAATNLTPDRTTTNDRWSSWSPDGTRLAFWSGIGNGLGTDAEIFSVTLDGGALTNLTHNQSGEAEPDWGPARPISKR